MEKINFDHNGVNYSMTPEEIEAAYGYRHRQDLLEDAERQLEIYVFGAERDCLDEEHIAEALSDFRNHHGIPYDLVLNHLDDIVARFEPLRREDVDDEMTWVIAIEAVVADLAAKHPTRYEELVEAYHGNPPFLFIVALYAILRHGANQMDESGAANLFLGYSLSKEQKDAAIKITMLMKRAEPDVLMAFVQRVMPRFRDYRGEKIPFLHPYGDEETVCPVCGRSGLKIKTDERMTTNGGGIAEWRCGYCNANGCAEYRLAFERHVMVEDGARQRVPNREWGY